jgi:integrase
MASISTDRDGNRRILFSGADGKRKAVYLGKMPMKATRTINAHIEHLVAAALAGHAPEPETAAWLGSRDKVLYGKLVAVGLVLPKEFAPKDSRKGLTLGQLVDEYITLRHDVRPRTKLIYQQARKSLLAHFGADKPIGELTAGDADCWRLAMLKTLAEGTVRKRCGVAKQILRWAMRRKLLGENPFADLPSTSVADVSRDHYVPVADVEQIMEHCPLEWRLILALCRFAGLRVPSELRSLTWADVLWDENALVVHAPKTERYAGKAVRQVPIAPELRSLLEIAFERAAEGETYVVARRNADQNLRTQLIRYAAKAGIELWGKPFMNMRQSLANDWAEQFPAHAVHAWLGHSKTVSEKHYLRVGRELFARATAHNLRRPKATQIPTQSGAANGSNEHANSPAPVQSPDALADANSLHYKGLQEAAGICSKSCADKEIHPTGLEPVTFGSVD